MEGPSRSVLQPIVALSTTEAEYIALSEAAKEGIWLKNLVSAFGINQASVRIRCDSSSALSLAANPTYHARSKHIDIRYQRIREMVVQGDIMLEKVPTKENKADGLTKVLPRDAHERCVEMLSLEDKSDL